MGIKDYQETQDFIEIIINNHLHMSITGVYCN